MGWLLHCNTGILRKHKLPQLCFASPSDNYVIGKTCSRNIMDGVILLYSEKNNLDANLIHFLL